MPDAQAAASVRPERVTARESGSERGPRGALEHAIKAALLERPGATESEIMEAMTRIDPRVSPRSVGGQLRRFRNQRYRQEGRRWFLMATEPEGTVEAATPSGVFS